VNRRASATAVLSLAGWLALGGCATTDGARRAGGAEAEARAGWRALEDGHAPEAARVFEARLAVEPGDLLARFGRATLAYEHGDAGAALDDYAAVVELASRASNDRATAAGTKNDRALTALMAPIAAARALALVDEVGAERRGRAEGLLLGLPDETALPWQARLELARLAERKARRAGDAVALERDAIRRGCARSTFDAGTLGPLPHLDLDFDRHVAASLAVTWAPVMASGCRLTVPARDGRPAAERLRVAVEVPSGDYALILDYDGEARLAVDGGGSLRHGSDARFGPRVSAFTLRLPAGRHELELRLATLGGRAELALLLLPRAAGAAVRFVDPRAGSPGRGGIAKALEAGPAADADMDAALRDYCLGFVADRVGDADEALTVQARLAVRSGFAPGLTLAASIARDDPTRPASFSRDAARGLLRAALAADAGDARAWQTLAAVELEDDHLREAIDDARAAARAAPRWWAPPLVLEHALRARGLDWDADRALDAAAAPGGSTAAAPCLLLESLLRRADDRRDLAARVRLEDALVACDASSETRIERLRARGELAAETSALRAALLLSPDRDDLVGDLAQALWADGHREAALAEWKALVAREPRDAFQRVHLADAQAAAGQAAAARATVGAALQLRPDSSEVRRAARAMGLPLPLDAYRLDGRAAIAAFAASGRAYAAPAVVVLDRSVERVFPDGTQLTLTHEIVRVQSKDAIDRWAEVEIPAGAEVLTLRTHKPDGTTREPEEIAGKETISAANVAIGDYIEWELLEPKAASGAFAPGFLGDRFFFQSFDAPLDRTELLLVTPRASKLAFDRRASAPTPTTSNGPDDTVVTTFSRRGVPQLFAERAAVPAIEYVPSVRASSGIAFGAWSRYVSEQLSGTTRSSPALRERARQIAAGAGAGVAAPSRPRLAAAVSAWVTDAIEAVDDLRDGATQTLARGSGNRLALMLALLHEVGVPARPVLARSRLLAEAAAPTPAEELDDFSDSILEIDVGGGRGPLYVDPRLRHAALGYLPPSLDGARTLSLPGGTFGVARSSGTTDLRSVDVTIRLDEQGGGAAVATEELTGWPALEWVELTRKFGADRARLRQDFEQRWLGVQFPGARLRELDVTLPKDEPGAAVRVRYSFVSPQLAVTGDHEMKLLPTFFRSQPGRRFAVEPQRSTTLVLGFDVPFHMTATLELPRAAKVEPTGALALERVERKGAYRFVEERRLRAARPSEASGGGAGLGGAEAPDVLVLTRDSMLPLTRVTPTDYAGVAADLRRVDGLEQREIRIRLRGARSPK
jgi:cellulose synthase operon protein C